MKHFDLLTELLIIWNKVKRLFKRKYPTVHYHSNTWRLVDTTESEWIPETKWQTPLRNGGNQCQ